MSNRRQFLKNLGISIGGAAASSATLAVSSAQVAEPRRTAKAAAGPKAFNTVIDFRFAPLRGQTAFCYPDDPHKSLVSERGELLCNHPGLSRAIHYFPQSVQFSVEGMEADVAKSQWLEKPGVPIIHTRLERPQATLELTTFATRRDGEGRVDNVILEVRPRGNSSIHVTPVVSISAQQAIRVQRSEGASLVRMGGENGPLFLLADAPALPPSEAVLEHRLVLESGVASAADPLRCFFRLPQEGQTFEQLRTGLSSPNTLLEEARNFWKQWKPFAVPVSWSLPGRHGEFLVACARNIQQAREVKEGRTTFQVGPTVYRGLWVADGHFLLEAARYLGYDRESQQGLEATWNRQRPDGGVFAGGGAEHWKETGIALLTIVRQAELAQDWSYFRKMQPNTLCAIEYVRKLRERARQEGGANGQYGLLPRGFPDGGIGGIRSEFTNTIWTLAGLKAASQAAERLGLSAFGGAKEIYLDLRSAFLTAAQQEMRLHPAGFDYLPMLMKDDPDWSQADEWRRPRPQGAQWALSQAIYPGNAFDRNDPIVKGHVALMQASTEEDIPAETGWLPHQGVWNYSAAFVAHVYLWAGLADLARRTFVGFLNHATPLYCWREEQPLRGSLVGSYIGDMPHNWASAECVLYLRHMLALEDGQTLRLLAGIGAPELSTAEPFIISESPTRFGRVSMDLEPLDGRQGWRLAFKRGAGPAPERLELPVALGTRFLLSEIDGARFARSGGSVLVEPHGSRWTATWKARRI